MRKNDDFDFEFPDSGSNGTNSQQQGSVRAPSFDFGAMQQPPVQPPVQQPIQPPVQPPVQQPVQPPVQPPVQQPVQPPVQQPMQAPLHRTSPGMAPNRLDVLPNNDNSARSALDTNGLMQQGSSPSNVQMNRPVNAPVNAPVRTPVNSMNNNSQLGSVRPSSSMQQSSELNEASLSFPNSMGVSDDTKPINDLRSELGNGNSDGNDIAKEASENIAKKKKRRKKILFRVGAAFLGLLLGVAGFLIWYYNYFFGKITYIDNSNQTIVDENGNIVNISDLTEETDNALIADDDIHNFLLIGIDSRSKSYTDDGTGALADVIMIMSVDNEAGTVKLMSVARDSYAYIPGYSKPSKINASMNYGGPELLQLTLENSLRIDIEGYAYVNFYNMAKVIDAVGGVYVNASSSEVYGTGGLNTNLAEINEIMGNEPSYQAVNQTGNIWLNGRQAVAYARIRYIGNGDYERSQRQVEVLRSLLNQFMNMSVAGKAAALDDILELVATNISKNEISSYALDFLPSADNLQMTYLQLPLTDFFNSGMYGSEWSIRPNWNMMIPYVQEYFYGSTSDFDRVDEIPSAPDDSDCPTDFNLAEAIS